MVTIYSIGGFTEVGKNMTAIDLGEDAFIIDNGFYLPAVVGMQEREKNMTEKTLRKIGALADDSVIKNIRSKVRAQFIGHGHLDHVGGVPFASEKYNAPIYGTPYTIEILKSLLLDNDIILKNKLFSVKPNTSFTVKGKNKNYQIEFIAVTHSILQTVLIAIHTNEGVILYCDDFKLDPTPVYNTKTNIKRLKEIAKEGVLCMIVDSLYADKERRTPSERIARALLDEIMTPEHIGNGGLVVTSFSSHIERLKSIVDFGNRMNKKIVFLGRSLDKYCNAAQNA
jgi:ribonuclease J